MSVLLSISIAVFGSACREKTCVIKRYKHLILAISDRDRGERGRRPDQSRRRHMLCAPHRDIGTVPYMYFLFTQDSLYKLQSYSHVVRDSSTTKHLMEPKHSNTIRPCSLGHSFNRQSLDTRYDPRNPFYSTALIAPFDHFTLDELSMLPRGR